MRYLLKFWTVGLSRERLPDLPKARGLTGFAGGLAAGTVAAVVLVANSPAPRHAIAIVDVSQSMQDDGSRDKALRQLLSRLHEKKISPEIIRASGFGLSSKGSPMNLLRSLETAVQTNPTIDSVYVFSDFKCETPQYDYNDEQGQLEFQKIIRDHHIRLFIGQLSKNDNPSADLVSFARSTPDKRAHGDWIDTNDSPILAEPHASDQVVIGTVRDATNGNAVPNADVSVRGFTSVKSGTDGTYRLELKGVQAGELQVRAESLDFPPMKLPIMVSCEHQRKDISLDIALTPNVPVGEFRITLTWDRLLQGKSLVPDDLDLHLRGPDDLHIYFDEKESSFANLEVDNVEHEVHLPLETMHIKGGANRGIFQLDVCDYNGEITTGDGIKQSRATVRVFDANGLVFQSTAATNGRYWPVFLFDATTRKFTPTSPESNIRPPPLACPTD